MEPYEIVYFMWYNSHRNKDVRFHLTVKKGMADLYVSTYDERNATDENLIGNLLPTSKRDSLWVLEDIRPITPVRNQILTLLNT